jgi:imidazolonepropionase-like amidohydrolase
LGKLGVLNVTTVYSFKVDEGEKKKKIVSRNIASHESLLFSNGRVACIGSDGNCSGLFDAEETIDLQGGTVIPGLLAFGSDLGLTDISAEPATQNGAAIGLMGSTLDRAVDGLRLGGHDLRFAHASGVTGIVSAPLSQEGIKQGIVTYFDAGVEDLLEEGSIKKEEVALHLTIDHWQASDDSQPTIGQQIASIRNAIKSAKAELNGKTTFKEDTTEEGNAWIRVVNGSLPLIVNVQQAETISQLIKIKEKYPTINFILSRADEASLGSIPARLKKAGIPVLITPIEWPTVYDARRALRIGGVSASAAEKRRKQGTTMLLGTLVKEGVQVGAMINEAWRSSTLMWDVVAAGEKAGLSREESLSLASAR